MGKRPHVLAVPYPAQGHVKPLMKLSQQLADHGMKVTFVNTNSIQAKLDAAAAAAPPKYEDHQSTSIRSVTILDALEDPDDSKREEVLETFTGLIKKINLSSLGEPVTLVIVDTLLGWILPVVEKMGIKQAVFWPAGPGCLALILQIPMFIEAGVMDRNGVSLKNKSIQLSKEMPACKSTEFPWHWPGDPIAQKFCIDMFLTVKQAAENAEWLLCNTSYELDSAACDFIPQLLPVGPLLASDCPTAFSGGSFWPEDAACLSWLDEQKPNSVIYISFGSIASISQEQFEELALGLELSGQPFLWVVRTDLTEKSIPEYPEGFLDRVSCQSKMVSWAPQEVVLAHPSISCFLSHCGWNSAMEAISNGVPLLCWPKFLDQFHNRNYIFDSWKIGLRLDLDGNGIISRKELEKKIQDLLSQEDDFKENALKLKEKARKSLLKGGSSYVNFQKFIEHLQRS